jgi:hypothetical protein
MPNLKRTFREFLADPSPALQVKFSPKSEEEPIMIHVKNKVGVALEGKGKEYLRKLCQDSRLHSFFAFYSVCDGLDLCAPYSPSNCEPTPLLRLIPSSKVEQFNRQYIGKGQWAWTIDLNKSKALYRGESSWIAFAGIGSGPSCLTIFLDGEHAGCVYLVAPQPSFNILKPIAKSFDLLLDKIVKDPAAFFRLAGSFVTMKKSDGQNYGFKTVGYIPDAKGQ